MIQDISNIGKTEFCLALESDTIISSIRDFKLGPLPRVGMPLRRKAGWALSGTGVVSTFGVAFAYYYYRQAQHNWEKAKTTAESDKYGVQRKVRGGITASLTAVALTTGITGFYLLLSEGEPPASIFPDVGYGDASGDEHFVLELGTPF